MDIELLAPVSPELLHKLEMYLIPHLVKYDNRLYPTKIYADQIEVASLKNAGAVGTGMSMGVDSFYTVHQYLNSKYKGTELTHLFVEQVGDLVSGITSKKHKRNVNAQTIDQVADRLNLPVVYGYSNLRQVLRMMHYHTHTYTAMFNIHMMAKLFKTYFYSSTEDFSNFRLANNSIYDAAYYELLSLQALSTNSLNLMSGGAASGRIEKIRELADNDVARKFLRVCLTQELNCMECTKCRRELLTMDMLGNLDKFKNAFDISTYKKNKEEYLKWLISTYHKNSIVQREMIKELYDFFYSRERDTMERLESLYLENYEPMELPRYFRVKNKVQKVDPSTGKKHTGTIKRGDVYFVDELYVKGVRYLRSKDDSSKNRDLAIAIGSLSDIAFHSLKKPRRLKILQNVKKINPYTGADDKTDIKLGTSAYFTDAITVNGIKYARTRHDFLKKTDLAIPMDSLGPMRTKIPSR